MNYDACNRSTYKQNLGIRGSMEMGSLRANDGADVMQSGPHSGATPDSHMANFLTIRRSAGLKAKKKV